MFSSSRNYIIKIIVFVYSRFLKIKYSGPDIERFKLNLKRYADLEKKKEFEYHGTKQLRCCVSLALKTSFEKGKVS